MSSRVVFLLRWLRRFYRPVSPILNRSPLFLESLENRLVPDGHGFSQILPQWNGDQGLHPPASVTTLSSNSLLVPFEPPSPPSSGLGAVPPDFSQFHFPTTLPAETITPTLSASVLTGNYQRHYTLYAQSPGDQVFLDVEIVSAVQFGTTSVTESGTLTVSQTIQQNGSLISQVVASVIPFSQTVPEDTNGLHYFGLDRGDGAPGYTVSGLLDSQISWNQVLWSDSAAFSTNGFWTFSDKTSFGLCSIDQSLLSYTSETNTLADGSSVTNDTTSTSWQSQLTLSDQPTNFPNLLLSQDNTLPAVLEPAANTHFYLQSRDAGTSQETCIETTPAAGSPNPASTVTIASSYAGADSIRYFDKNSATALLTPQTADPLLNTETQPYSGFATASWLIDTQTSGNYSGSSQGNFNLATPTTPIGSLTYNDIRHDTTTTDTLNLSEEIYLTDNDTQYFEQTTLQQSLTQPLLEDSTLTQTLGYDLPLIVGPVIDSQITSNTLAYSYSASQGAIQSSITDQFHLRSNAPATQATTTTPATPASYLTLSGYFSASGSDQSQGTISGTYDLINKTQTVNDNLAYQSHWVSTDFGTLGYNENGTIPVALRSLSFSQSQTDSSGNSTQHGGFDATGKQISGISQSHDQSTTTIPQFWSWSQLSGVNQPTLTEYQEGVGQEVFTSNTNLSFDTEGKATGTFDLSLVSAVASTITSALVGTLYLDPIIGTVSEAFDPALGASPTHPPFDSITFTDQSQALIQAGTVFQTQLAWASDVPTGTVVLGQSAQITSISLDNRAFVSNHGKDHAQFDANDGGQIRVIDQIMRTIAGDLLTTTGATDRTITYAGQSQLIADGKLDVAETGQTGDYHLEGRTRYRIQDTESIQSLWSNDAWTETGHNFTVDHEAHDAWAYNQTVNLPKNSDPIITNNGDGTTTASMVQLGQDQSTLTSTGGYDYHLTQSGSPSDFVFALGHTSQSQSGKHDTGTWRAANGTSGATYDNLGSETKNSRANLSGRVQNGSVYYDGIDVYQTKNTSTNNTGSGFALGQTTNSHTVGSTQTIETRGGNSGSWYGSKLESGNTTTNYTTVSGTMGQPFSGMTQTGFNTMTLYGTAAQTGISGSYGSNQYGQTAPSGPAQLPNIPAPNVGDYPPKAQAKLNTIYNAYRQSAANQAYYASQYANRPGNHFVTPSLANQLQQIKESVMNGSLRPDVNQSEWEYVLDCVQTGLDVVGMVPIVGEVADGINVGIHAYRGNYSEAALSGAAMVPWIGAGVTAAKYARNIGKVGIVVPANPNQAANLTSLGKGIKEAESRAFIAGQEKSFPGCFVKGTLVTTTFGPHPIDQIQVGDKVLAYDLKTGNWLPTPVLNTFQSDYRGFKTTIITENDQIGSTFGHPFWVLRGKDLDTRPQPEEMLELPRMISLPGRWVEAGQVQIGDQLLLVNGKEVSVEEVVTVPYAEKVFNLEIAEIHTYAVGKTGVLVHNSNPCGAGGLGDELGKVGSRTTPGITAPTNRAGLRKAMGQPPAEMANPNAHHDLPWKYKDWFAGPNRGLNVNDAQFGRWVEGRPPGGHQKWTSVFETEWQQFISRNRNANANDVIDFMNNLRNDMRFQ